MVIDLGELVKFRDLFKFRVLVLLDNLCIDENDYR